LSSTNRLKPSILLEVPIANIASIRVHHYLLFKSDDGIYCNIIIAYICSHKR